MFNTLLSCLVLTLFDLRCTASLLDRLTPPPTRINSTKNFDNALPGTSIINVTNAFDDLVGCFRQTSPGQPQLYRTNFIDCFHAEEKIIAQDPRNPVHFRRDSGSIFLLPNSFTYRTCVIFLDMVDANDEDSFYIAEVRDVAIDTARKCTANPKALGGKGLAGPKKLVELYVMGRP